MILVSLGVVLMIAGIAIGLYAYVIYHLIVVVLARLAPGVNQTNSDEQWPDLTVVLPVHNEEHVVADTLEAILAVDYPRDRMQVLVVSDASEDRTDDIVRSYENRGVRLLRIPQRAGKTAAENAARFQVRGDIVVNTDASVRISPDGLKPLIRVFGDPEVGVALGRDVSILSGESDANVAEWGYVGYEMWVRDWETRAGGIVGASGCFFASRSELHERVVPNALSRDFAAPLIAREGGYRSVSVRDAVCYVPRQPSLRGEYRRKVRTMTRGLETLFYHRHLLNPLRYGRFAWMLMSHKLIRWFVPWAALGVLAGAALVAFSTGHVLILSIAFLGLGFLAALTWGWPFRRRMPLVLAFPGMSPSHLLPGCTHRLMQCEVN